VSSSTGRGDEKGRTVERQIKEQAKRPLFLSTEFARRRRSNRSALLVACPRRIARIDEPTRSSEWICGGAFAAGISEKTSGRFHLVRKYRLRWSPLPPRDGVGSVCSLQRQRIVQEHGACGAREKMLECFAFVVRSRSLAISIGVAGGLLSGSLGYCCEGAERPPGRRS
jgi:hypothetical protein